MEIYREPADYQAVGREVIYGITGADPAKTIEVDIRAGNDRKTIGIKRFCGEAEYLVNVAGYLRGVLDVEPVAIQRTGVTTARSRCIATEIAVGTVASQQTFITAGNKDAVLFARLSDAPQRSEIAPGERDEIAWIAPQSEASVQIRFGAVEGTDLEIVTDSVVGDDEMTILLIDADDLAERIEQAGRTWSDFNNMNVTVAIDGETAFSRQYILQKQRTESIRLCWVNPYGAVDYHTFHCCAGERMKIEKTRLETQNGIEILSAHTEIRYTLLSAYEPRNVMRWLAGLAAAPRVWIANNALNTFEPVDVITQQVVVHDQGALSRLEITIRPTMKNNC